MILRMKSGHPINVGFRRVYNTEESSFPNLSLLQDAIHLNLTRTIDDVHSAITVPKQLKFSAKLN